MSNKRQNETSESAKTAPILLNRDFWAANGQRHKKGAVVDVPTAIAKELINEGRAERADPMPGDEG